MAFYPIKENFGIIGTMVLIYGNQQHHHEKRACKIPSSLGVRHNARMNNLLAGKGRNKG